MSDSSIDKTSPTASTTLLLARHAETGDNVNLRLSGWTDTDLSETGHAQVARLADHVRAFHPNVAAVYASPLLRARRTAEAMGRRLGQQPIFMDDLREMFFGELDGLPFEEIKDTYAHLLKADEDPSLDDFRWPGGESRLEFSQRVSRALALVAGSHPGREVAVVTHGGVIATFLTRLHGQSGALWRKWVVPNASLTVVHWDSVRESGVMERHGDSAHLKELATAGPTKSA